MGARSPQDSCDFDALVDEIEQTVCWGTAAPGVARPNSVFLPPPPPPPPPGRIPVRCPDASAQTAATESSPPDASDLTSPPRASRLSPAAYVAPCIDNELAAFDVLCRRLIADAADAGWPGDAEAYLDLLLERSAFISPEHVCLPLLVVVYATWRAYPGIDARDARARFALAELVAAMIEIKIMPRAQVLNALAAAEARCDWQGVIEEVALADRFMLELRTRLDAWVPVWGNRG